jgi:hypothetical protein
MAACGHPLCALIGGPCSLAVARSRGCTPNAPAAADPDLFDQIRVLLATIDADPAAPARLAELIRREAREGRSVLAHARVDEPELVPALERLCLRER